MLELDDDIFKEDSEMYLKKESIYIINNNSISYSIINSITKKELRFNCNLSNNSFYYPIFRLTKNKLLGIYKKDSKCYHKGIFFKYIIKQLESKYLKKDMMINLSNEIEISIKIDKKDINNHIYFLDNEYIENNKKKSLHDNLKELNKINTELYIKKNNEEKKEEYKKLKNF